MYADRTLPLENLLEAADIDNNFYPLPIGDINAMGFFTASSRPTGSPRRRHPIEVDPRRIDPRRRVDAWRLTSDSRRWRRRAVVSSRAFSRYRGRWCQRCVRPTEFDDPHPGSSWEFVVAYPVQEATGAGDYLYIVRKSLGESYEFGSLAQLAVPTPQTRFDAMGGTAGYVELFSFAHP